MRYLLVLGFSCDVYRQEPRARIYVGNHLVDEFQIPHTPSNFFTAQQEVIKKLHPLQPFALVDLNNLLIKNHPPLKFYELQVDDGISDLAIRIHIDNHDSNYSNGYMSRSTMLRLDICAFFPLELKVLESLKKIRDRRRITKNYAWYRSNKNHVFDLALNGMRWQGENDQKFSSTEFFVFRERNIGGDGEYVCELSKKYGILMPTLARVCRHTFNYHIISYFFDKYFHYAHQRDSN